MAAVMPLLVAAALSARGLEGRRATWLHPAADGVVPDSAGPSPTVALLWLVGVGSVTPWRRVLPGLVIGVRPVVAAVVVMAHLEGGWAAFVEPFVTHGSFHVDRLHRNTRGSCRDRSHQGRRRDGGSSGAGGLSMVGLVVWWRRLGARAALAWVAILGLTTAQLVMLQNRSYARYAVGVQMATAPLLAGAASLVAPPVAVTGLLGMTGFAAWKSSPVAARTASRDLRRLAGHRRCSRPGRRARSRRRGRARGPCLLVLLVVGARAPW